MTEPNAREREIAAAVNLGSGNWTKAIAQALADYRAELGGSYVVAKLRCGHTRGWADGCLACLAEKVGGSL